MKTRHNKKTKKMNKNYLSKFFLLASKNRSTNSTIITPEARAICFQQNLNEKIEFETYLIHKKMRRDLERLEKRKMFITWYTEKYQNVKSVKLMIYELSEILFVSTRTVENVLFSKEE